MEQESTWSFFSGKELMNRNRLRDVRVLKRITQFQLRLSTGIHQSKISMIENGLILPRGDEKKALAKALGVSQGDLFPEGTEKEPERQRSASCQTNL